MTSSIDAVIFDVGNVLYQWDIRNLYAKLIDDPAEVDRFVSQIVTPEWHYQHDAGRPLAAMTDELKAEYPEHAALIDAYVERWLETIPGPVPGMIEIARTLAAKGVPLYAITNFGVEFWVEGLDDGKNKYSSDVLFLIWNALKAEGIEIPYPRRVIEMRGGDDGKPSEA